MRSTPQLMDQLMDQLQQEKNLRQQLEVTLQESLLVNAKLRQELAEQQTVLGQHESLERELLESKQRLEALFAQSLDGFFFMMLEQPIRWNHAVDREAILDYVFSHQHMVRVNEAMLTQYGAAEQDFLGLTPQDFFAHDLPLGRQIWQTMFDQGHVHIETQEHKFDGTPIWIDGDYICLYNQTGEIIGHFGIQRDITDRKYAESELERFNQALSYAMEGISRIDPQGRYIQVNHAYANTVGYSPEAMIGMAWQKTVHPDDLKVLQLAYQRMIEQGKVEVDARGIRPDGSFFYKQLVMVTAYDMQQQMTGHYCFMKDISERKRHEEILQNIALGVSAKTGTAFFQALVEYLSKALGMEFAFVCELIPPERQLIRTIAGYGDGQALENYEYELEGTPCEQVIGSHQQIFTYPHQIQQQFPQDNYLKDIQAESYMGFPLIDSNGQILGLISVVSRQPIEDPDFMAHILQIFAARAAAELERQQAEAKLHQQKADLARSNAELQQFAYVASHDLQEPLRMVTSYLELLERRYKGQLDPKADQFINYAVDGAVRMQTLINALLTYSRVGSTTQSYEAVDLAGVLQDVLTNLQVTVAKNDAMITHDPLPTVQGDRTQLIQLLQNLISNGIKFRREDIPHIHIGAKRLSDKWLFSIRDNGIGIEAQYNDRIFIIFQRLHSRAEHPGTGIGLSICKKIIERHSGDLWVESQPNQGSVFYFTLPLIPKITIATGNL